MNSKNIIPYLPYVLLLLANIIYLYANGLRPIGTYPQLFVYNVVFFIVVGVLIMIKANLLLHSWFIKEQGDVKKKTRDAIQKAKSMFDFGLSIFKKGNQKMLIKIFLLLNVWILLNKYIPGFLLGLLIGTYFQYKGFVEEKFKNELKQLDEQKEKIINQVVNWLPKYSNEKLANQ